MRYWLIVMTIFGGFAMAAERQTPLDTSAKEEKAIEVSMTSDRGAVTTPATPKVIVATVVEEPAVDLNISVITYDLITRDMGEQNWGNFVKKVQGRFKDWSQEYDNNNVKQFLDDRLLELAPSVTSGKGNSLKEFCKWMALYKVYSEQLPAYIRDLSDKDKRWIRDTLSDFNWDNAAAKIKAKAQK